MSYQLMMFCTVGPDEVRAFGGKVCAEVAAQYQGVTYSQVRDSEDSSKFKIETTSGQELDVEFLWAGMFFELSITAAAGEPDAGAAANSSCIIKFDLSGDVPWSVISGIWSNVHSNNSAVLHDEMDGFAASLDVP